VGVDLEMGRWLALEQGRDVRGFADIGDGAVESGFGRCVLGAEETVHFAEV